MLPLQKRFVELDLLSNHVAVKELESFSSMLLQPNFNKSLNLVVNKLVVELIPDSKYVFELIKGQSDLYSINWVFGGLVKDINS